MSSHEHAAVAVADPVELPPGVRCSSPRGLKGHWKSHQSQGFSLEANAVIFVLPTITAPRSMSNFT